ncbi:hypothetical protein SUGI_0109640 [Cryptomeria japonica]|nr:hypothetical protein SUGI_0109640 [Cryptomeria japonica]
MFLRNWYRLLEWSLGCVDPSVDAAADSAAVAAPGVGLARPCVAPCSSPVPPVALPLAEGGSAPRVGASVPTGATLLVEGFPSGSSRAAIVGASHSFSVARSLGCVDPSVDVARDSTVVAAPGVGSACPALCRRFAWATSAVWCLAVFGVFVRGFVRVVLCPLSGLS